MREKRKASGLSLKRVAEITGMSKASLSLYENKKRNLSVKRAKELARVYGCVWEELFEDEAESETG